MPDIEKQAMEVRIKHAVKRLDEWIGDVNSGVAHVAISHLIMLRNYLEGKE